VAGLISKPMRSDCGRRFRRRVPPLRRDQTARSRRPMRSDQTTHFFRSWIMMERVSTLHIEFSLWARPRRREEPASLLNNVADDLLQTKVAPNGLGVTGVRCPMAPGTAQASAVVDGGHGFSRRRTRLVTGHRGGSRSITIVMNHPRHCRFVMNLARRPRRLACPRSWGLPDELAGRARS